MSGHESGETSKIQRTAVIAGAQRAVVFVRSPLAWGLSLSALGVLGGALLVAIGTVHPSLYDRIWPSAFDRSAVILFDAPNGTFKHEIMPASGPLSVHPTNPRYFRDASGHVAYLTGSHTWANLQDGDVSDPPDEFDYARYLDDLRSQNHNFFRLWIWEQSRGAPRLKFNVYYSPPIYERTGPGLALDGKPKFDLSRFNQDYFDRLRQHVALASDRGIYVSIMLFNGWSIEDKGLGGGNPWLAHPFHASNNINDIDGDLNGDQQGHEIHSLQVPTTLSLQEAYVRKVVDTVNSLPNVLYEISNESHASSQDWQYHVIRYLKDYQATKPSQHPIGMTVEWPDGNNAELFASPADWISPNEYFDPPDTGGQKVVINDTDHLWGIGGNRQWVWKSFVRGTHPIFMDPYDEAALWLPAGGNPDDPRWVSIRQNMGYTLSFAHRINLAAMSPRADLCDTRYCLANPSETGAEYLVYLPTGRAMTRIRQWFGLAGASSRYFPSDSTTTVDLSGTPGELAVEWHNPATGQIARWGVVNGGSVRSFTAPFSGDAVLYLHQKSSRTEP